MKFCRNCGKELNDDAVFCTNCGVNTNAPPSGSSGPAEAPNMAPPAGNPAGQSSPPDLQGGFYQGGVSGSQYNAPGGPGGYYQNGSPQDVGQYSQNTQNPQGGYYQGNSAYQGQQPGQGSSYYQNSQPGQGNAYYQGGTPQSGPNVPPGQFYPGGAPRGGPYGGPNYPKAPNNSKALVIVIVAIIAVLVIGGGIFAITKLSHKGTSLSDYKPSPSVSDAEDAETSPSEEPAASPSEDTGSPSPSAEETTAPVNGTDALSIFDSKTEDNILSAFDEIGLDTSGITDLDYYNDWLDGSAYTFTYKDSVIDMLLLKDGKVFSIETSGVQVYLESYESYAIDSYLGGTRHYDEQPPTSGYVFWANGKPVDSSLHIAVSDDSNYLVELIDASTGSPVTAFYVEGGSTQPMVVPAGTYKVQYAAGETWKGVKYLFGENTAFFELSSPVTVGSDSDGSITLDATGGTGDQAVQTDGSGF